MISLVLTSRRPLISLYDVHAASISEKNQLIAQFQSSLVQTERLSNVMKRTKKKKKGKKHNTEKYRKKVQNILIPEDGFFQLYSFTFLFLFSICTMAANIRVSILSLSYC